MIEKILMAESPNKDLYLHFVINAQPKDADSILIEFATHEMRQRLEEQREKGFAGWNTAQVENIDLKERLLKNLENGDYVDVLNLAAMLLARTHLFKEVILQPKS